MSVTKSIYIFTEFAEYLEPACPVCLGTEPSLLSKHGILEMRTDDIRSPIELRPQSFGEFASARKAKISPLFRENVDCRMCNGRTGTGMYVFPRARLDAESVGLRENGFPCQLSIHIPCGHAP
jgi:hypothetical protein